MLGDKKKSEKKLEKKIKSDGGIHTARALADTVSVLS